MRSFQKQSLMRIVLLTVLYAVQIAAAIRITNTALDPAPGEDFTITWVEAEGPVEIILGRGPSTNIERVSVIATDLSPTSGEYVWAVPTDLQTSDDYFFIISDGPNSINYSVQFSIEGTGEDSTPDVPSTTIRPTTTTARSTRSSSDETPESTSTSSEETRGPTRTSSEEASDSTESSASSFSSPSRVSSADAGEASESEAGGGDVGNGEGGDNTGGGGTSATTIGIAVGVSLGGVGLLGLLAGYWFFRKSRRSKATLGTGGSAAGHPSHPELGGSEPGTLNVISDAKGTVEMGGTPMSELHSPVQAHEMSGVKESQPPVELSADEYKGRQ